MAASVTRRPATSHSDAGPDSARSGTIGVVEVAALGLLVLGVALAEPVSRALAAARWPARDPVGALLVWQAVGLAGGLALVGAGAVYGLAPLGPDLATALAVLVARPAAVLTVGTDHLLGLAVGAGLASRLLGVMAATTTRTLRARRRHCDLLDVLATPWPAVPGAHVLDHAAPVACASSSRPSRRAANRPGRPRTPARGDGSRRP